MNNRTQILNELEIIAPVLVNTPIVMPYKLPEAYFETFAALVLEKIGLDENLALAPHLLNISTENPYTTPVGYFEGLSDAIMDRIYKAENEADIPQGYFESLPDIFLNKIHSIEVQQELKELAPILNTIDKQPVNFVPQGYFKNLQPATEAKETAEVKVVSIKRKTNWFKYAVAACLTGAIAFITFSIINRQAVTDPAVAININEELSKLPDTTIENYLTTEVVNIEPNTIAYQEVKDEDITAFLKEFTEEDLQQYLKNEGEDVTSN